MPKMSRQAPKYRKKMNNPKMNRTSEGTAFEAVTAIILLTELITACLRPRVLPLGVMLPTWTVVSAAAVLLLVIAYYPNSHFINIPVRRDPTNVAQMFLVSRLMRILAVLCALTNGAIIISTLPKHDYPGGIMATATGMAIVVVIAYYTFRIRQAGKMMEK